MANTVIDFYFLQNIRKMQVISYVTISHMNDSFIWL